MQRRGLPLPAGNAKQKQCPRRIRTHPAGNAVPGAPRSDTHVSHNFGRIRNRSPVGKGLAPSGRKRPDPRQPRANPQTCSAFAQGSPCRTVCCAERASPFPTMRRLRIRRTWQIVFGGCCGTSRTPSPTIKCCDFARRVSCRKILLPGPAAGWTPSPTEGGAICHRERI